MPRTARASAGNVCYHALNRGNGGAVVFHDDGDYEAFAGLLRDASERIPMRILAWALMPNHFHFLLWPHEDGDLGRWMQWLMTAHVRRHHRHHGSAGHIWQGRFRAFPIQDDWHLSTVARYVERNPVRAGLVDRAELWPWSSAAGPDDPRPPLLCAGPIARGSRWLELLNAQMDDPTLTEIRRCVTRGTPYGDDRWRRAMAERLGLQASLNPRGRPRLSGRE
jgi:putative transposase